MGDRISIAMQDRGERVYFYGHWSGHGAPLHVQRALSSKAGRARRSDGPYLARIVFCEFVGEASDAELSFGISAQPVDTEYPVIVVDVDAQRVRFEDADGAFGPREVVGHSFTFDRYCELDMEPDDPWTAVVRACRNAEPEPA